MSQVTLQGIDELLAGAVERGAVPGAAAVVVDRDGPLAHATAGVLRLGEEAPVTETTFFRYASMTKAIVSVAALQLVEQGRLGLDDPVADHVPEAADLRVLDGWDGDVPRLRAPASAPTVRQLLTHTAGAGYFFSSPDLARWHEVTGAPNVLTGQRSALLAPLVHDPGTTWEYGVNTDWLGLVVEAVAGTSLDQHVRAQVLDPLGMDSVTFAPDDAARAELMAVHHRTPDGALVAGELGLAPEPEFWAAGHGLYGQAADHGKFLRFLLGNGGDVLKPETLELLFTDQLGGIPLPELISSAAPPFINPVPSAPWRQGWGLGLHLTLEDLPGMRRAGSGDWAGLFNCYFWVDRTSAVAATFFTQVLPFFDEACVGTALALEQAVYTA